MRTRSESYRLGTIVPLISADAFEKTDGNYLSYFRYCQVAQVYMKKPNMIHVYML